MSRARHTISQKQLARQSEARTRASIAAAQYVREAREAAGMTQRDLARALGVHASRICDIESRRGRKQKGVFMFDTVSLAFLCEVQRITSVPLLINGKSTRR